MLIPLVILGAVLVGCGVARWRAERKARHTGEKIETAGREERFERLRRGDDISIVRHELDCRGDGISTVRHELD
jgi:hypothetical protein